MARHSFIRGNEIEYGFWLVFDVAGNVRLVRGKPDIARDERAVSMTAKLPLSLFKTPELRAIIRVPDNRPQPIEIDIEAVSSVLEMALGVDVDLKVNTPEQP